MDEVARLAVQAKDDARDARNSSREAHSRIEMHEARCEARWERNDEILRNMRDEFRERFSKIEDLVGKVIKWLMWVFTGLAVGAFTYIWTQIVGVIG